MRQELSAMVLSLLLVVPAYGQSVDDQLKQQQLEAARLANEKARLGFIDPLRTITPPDAKIATPEKAAEAQLLRIMLYQGLASRLADRIKPPSGVAPESFAPIVVMGATPPTSAHWAAFAAQRGKLDTDMKHALDRWAKVHAAYCVAHAGCTGKKAAFAAAALAVEAATTLYALFKTDLSAAGASIQAPAGDLETYLLAALKGRRYAVDLDRYGMPDGKADAEDLLAPVKASYDALNIAYSDQYLPIVVGAEGGKPEKIGDDNVAAMGQVLKALIDAYEALEKSLYTAADGTLAATTIERERLISTNRSTSPVLFVTGQDAALTTTTRKGVFVRSSTATTLTAAATANYVLVVRDEVPSGSKTGRKAVSAELGTVSCIIRDLQPASALVYDAAADPSAWPSNCESDKVANRPAAAGPANRN